MLGTNGKVSIGDQSQPSLDDTNMFDAGHIDKLAVGGMLSVVRNGYTAAAYIYNTYQNRYHAALALRAGVENPTDVAQNSYIFFYDGDSAAGGNNNWPTGAISGGPTTIGIYSISDLRMKKDVRPAEVDSKSILKNIDMIEYRMNDQSEDEPLAFGFSAQNLLEVYPKAVMRYNPQEDEDALKKDQEAAEDTADDGLLMVCPANLIPVLVKDAQRQQDEVETLTSENKAMMEC